MKINHTELFEQTQLDFLHLVNRLSVKLSNFVTENNNQTTIKDVSVTFYSYLVFICACY